MCNTKECIAILQQNMPRIQQEFGVTALGVFGSVARGDNRPDSDVDILVDMPPKIFIMSACKDFLESILNTTVDLVRRHSHMSQQFLTQISRDAITIF